MEILSYKAGHDGTVAVVRDGELICSYEGEKGSNYRYSPLSPLDVVASAELLSGTPDALCVSGWMKGHTDWDWQLATGYRGFDESSVVLEKRKFFGREACYFSSPHERSHLMCSYGLSPFAQEVPVYALIWEGEIGAFYEIDEQVRIRKISDVLKGPGDKYAYLFQLADTAGTKIFSSAGKLMALAAYGNSGKVTKREKELIDFILSSARLPITNKKELAWCPYTNIGVESQAFKDAARKISDAIFDRFYHVAEKTLTKGYPLLIGGGCGLNCEWNTRWAESGLFPEVFVPPCTNDTGSAIGTAIDAQFHLTGNAKLRWDVYSGQEMEFAPWCDGEYEALPLDLNEVAAQLSAGEIVPWIQGRVEIGPRALGNRSILASPVLDDMCSRINALKGREGYRPVAPICIEERAAKWFSGPLPSPHMLHFHKVKTDKLPAITHVDGSARVQTVSQTQNSIIYSLLEAFERQTGVGVLCNTSLNFPGRGFINSTEELVRFCKENDLKVAVMGNFMIVHKSVRMRLAA